MEFCFATFSVLGARNFSRDLRRVPLHRRPGVRQSETSYDRRHREFGGRASRARREMQESVFHGCSWFWQSLGGRSRSSRAVGHGEEHSRNRFTEDFLRRTPFYFEEKVGHRGAPGGRQRDASSRRKQLLVWVSRRYETAELASYAQSRTEFEKFKEEAKRAIGRTESRPSRPRQRQIAHHRRPRAAEIEQSSRKSGD